MGSGTICCCNCIDEIKPEKSRETIEKEFEIELDDESVIQKLSKSRKKVQKLLDKNIEYFFTNSECSIGLEETEKGHIFKIVFNLSKSPISALEFFENIPRTKWDKLIESFQKIQETQWFSLYYIKYRSQISYSAKEFVIACTKQKIEEDILVYYTSIPAQKQLKNLNSVEIYSGGYLIHGQNESAVTAVFHFKVGETTLTSFLRRLSEKMIPDVITSLKKTN